MSFIALGYFNFVSKAIPFSFHYIVFVGYKWALEAALFVGQSTCMVVAFVLILMKLFDADHWLMQCLHHWNTLCCVSSLSEKLVQIPTTYECGAMQHIVYVAFVRQVAIDSLELTNWPIAKWCTKSRLFSKMTILLLVAYVWCVSCWEPETHCHCVLRVRLRHFNVLVRSIFSKVNFNAKDDATIIVKTCVSFGHSIIFNLTQCNAIFVLFCKN